MNTKRFQITKKIEWDMGHRIPNHKSKCKNPHGHRYVLEVFLGGDINKKTGGADEGMILDFTDIKVILNEFVHDVCDHGFMYYGKDDVMSTFYKENPSLKHIAVPFIPTAEEISHWIFNVLEKEINARFESILTLEEVHLWETPTSCAITKK